MIYLRDAGVLHALLEIPDRRALLGHAAVGLSWEGFAIEQVLAVVQPAAAYFWATHGGAELDLLFVVNGRRYGVEVKFRRGPSRHAFDAYGDRGRLPPSPVGGTPGAPPISRR